MAELDQHRGAGDYASAPEVVYLDYNATAPLRPEALNAILGVLQSPGNAASVHALGRSAAAAVAHARAQLAALLGCRSSELVVTSGATEANNLALRTALQTDGQLVVSAVEHPAVLEAARVLAEQHGCSLVVVGVDGDGLLRLDQLRNALRDGRPSLVSVMAANNETGVLADLEAIAAITHDAGGLLHTDATQLVGRLPLDLSVVPVDLLSLSAHKFGGPQGVGALFIRRGVPVPHRPLLVGGGQERGWRAGTLNVAGIVGMGAAAEAARLCLDEERERVRRLRDRLEAALLDAVTGARRNGSVQQRLPGVSSLTFPGVPTDALLAAMPQLAASNGSACASGALTPSHVLLAMGLTPEDADSTLRLSLGHATTEQDVDRAIEYIISAVNRVRRAMQGSSEPPCATTADPH